MPLSYVELGALGQALTRYQEAIALYGQESALLDESIAAIRAGRLIEGLLAANPSATPGAEMSWFDAIQQLPAMPHAGHLADVLAQHEFQEALQEPARPALPGRQPAGVAGQDRGPLATCGGPPPSGLRPAPASGAGPGQCRRPGRRCSSSAMPWPPSLNAWSAGWTSSPGHACAACAAGRVQRVNASLEALADEPGLDAAPSRPPGHQPAHLAANGGTMPPACGRRPSCHRPCAQRSPRPREPAGAPATGTRPLRRCRRTQAGHARIAALIPGWPASPSSGGRRRKGSSSRSS